MTATFISVDANIDSCLKDYTGANYDSKAKTYEKLVASELYNKIIWGTSPNDYKEFGKRAILNASGSLLDVGCGGLVQTADIYRSANRACVLVDNSIEMLKIGKERLVKDDRFPESIKLLQADAFHLPFSDNHFDSVCSFGMIHLFDNKQDFINEALRVVKVGGTFYFSTMTTKRAISRWYMKQLQKMNEFGTPSSVDENLAFFNQSNLTINSYVKGSMLFIEGKKNS